MTTKLFRHKKRGTVYEVLNDFARNATNAQPPSRLVIYRAVCDPLQWWSRDYDEFFDGRFEEITP